MVCSACDEWPESHRKDEFVGDKFVFFILIGLWRDILLCVDITHVLRMNRPCNIMTTKNNIKGATQMDDGQKVFFDFIMERTQDGKQEAMAAALEAHFKPPEESGFDPDAFMKGIEVIISMLKPEAVPEILKMMDPFGGMEDSDEPIEIKDVLKQPNKEKWRDNTPKEEMRAAFACSKKAHEMKCDCWNTNCVFYGDCRKCIVFHLCLKQFPTCQRALLGDLEEHYIEFSRDQERMH
jgi:hypothetical protein